MLWGFKDSPQLVAQAWAQVLIQFSQSQVKVIQYVDYIFLCAPTKETSQQGTQALLVFLARKKKGYKVPQSQTKLFQISTRHLGI